MLSSVSDFPKDELVNCLRNHGKGKEEFVKEAKKLNIQWIYEIIKYCCNIFFEIKEIPDTKFAALTLVKDLLQTCEVPCVHLIEVYVLPVIYQFAIYKPQQKADKRGNFFFQNNGFSSKLPNIQETGRNFIALCSEMLYFGSLVKNKRTFEDEELDQLSEFIQFYEKFKDYGIDGSPKSPKNLQYFTEKTVKTAHQKYIKNLKEFEEHCEGYGEFFVFKMVQSLQSEQNALFSSAGKTISSLNNDLDMRKLLKYGDTYITSPLLQELTEGLKSAENFLIKRNFLSLLTDFVKWADIESFVQICYDDALDTIAPRIAQVNGQKGLNEGEFIYPELKGQKQAKKKFYIEFLKSLEIWSKCIKGDLQDEQQLSKVEQFYEYFKVERKFVFPENLMSKRIESDFAKCQQFNSERNKKILQKLKNDKTSLLQGKKSASINKAALAKSSQLAKEKLEPVSFQEINNLFEDCFENFITLADEQDQIAGKMKKLKAFKQNFDKDLQNVEEDGRPFEEFQQLLDNGDQLIENIEAVEDLYDDYKKKKITFKEFQKQFQVILEQMEDMEEEEAQQSNMNSSNNNDTSLSITQSKKSLKKKPSDGMGSSPVVTSPKLEKQPSVVEESQSKISNLSKKLKSRKGSQLHNSNLKSSVRNKKSSYVVSNIPNQSSPGQDNQLHPYYDQVTENKPRISKLSRLQNKSIHSKKSGLAEKLKQRRSELSQSSSFRLRQSQIGQSSLASGNDYMMMPKKSEKKSFKEMIQSHRSSRISEKSSQLRSNLQREAKRDSKAIDSKIVYYEKNDEAAVINFNDQSQVLTEQVNEGYGIVPFKSSIRRDKVRSKNQQIKGESKAIVSNLSRKSLLRDKNNKVSSVLKSSRRSSHSRISGVSSKEQDKNRQNIGNNPKNDKADDYMMQPSKVQSKHKLTRFSQLSGKRPASSHSKYKAENHEPKVSTVDKKSYVRPQTSSNQQLPKSQQIQDHYQIRRAVNEQDKIREHDLKPMENSYYGIEEIEAKVKNSSKMEFKQCFQLDKQVIQVNCKKIPTINDPGIRKGKSTNQSSSLEEMNINKNPQEEYLMMKLRKEHGHEQNDQLKRIQGRILKLKTETSKIRRELSSRSQDNRQFSLSRRSYSGASSRQFCSFSSSKNSRNSSFHSISKERVNTSRAESLIVEGRLLNTNNYDRHYSQIRDQNVKKTFLRSKVILLKNEYLELGSVFRRQMHNLKIMMYLTASADISNLNISVAKQYNMQIGVFPDAFPEIPRGKQVRINLEVEIKSAPYSMPTMYVNFAKGGREQSYTIFLPCSLHRFVQFHSITDRQSFLSRFESVGQNIIKTPEFKMSKRVGKLDHIQEYFPKLTTLHMNGDTHKYGAECVFKRERFLILITTRKPQSIVIQGIPLTRPEFLEYLLSFFRHIFTMDQ